MRLKGKESQLTRFLQDTGETRQRQRVLVAGFDDGALKKKAAEAYKAGSQSDKETNKQNITTNITAQNTPRFSAMLEKAKETAGTEYIDSIKKTFGAGSEKAKALVERYAPDNINFVTDDITHTDKNGELFINYKDDLADEHGADMIFFHEMGHVIDHKNNYISVDSGFNEELYFDAENIVDSLAPTQGKKKITKKDYDIAMRRLMEKYSDNNAADGLSDILGGATDNMLRFGYGHGDKYWKKNSVNLELETFADFFEAQFNGESNKILRDHLPNTAAIFDEIMLKLFGGE